MFYLFKFCFFFQIKNLKVGSRTIHSNTNTYSHTHTYLNLICSNKCLIKCYLINIIKQCFELVLSQTKSNSGLLISYLTSYTSCFCSKFAMVMIQISYFCFIISIHVDSTCFYCSISNLTQLISKIFFAYFF
jgi:hypothetical protein